MSTLNQVPFITKNHEQWIQYLLCHYYFPIIKNKGKKVRNTERKGKKNQTVLRIKRGIACVFLLLVDCRDLLPY